MGVAAALTLCGWAYGADRNAEVAAARAELAKMAAPTPVFATIAKVMKPSVVKIVTKQKVQARVRRIPWPEGWPGDMLPGPGEGDDEQEVQGLGSGVIVDGAGYILTNNHVVGEAEEGKITVYLEDETAIPATLVGTDPKTDLAVLKIDAKDLVVAKLGDSDALEVGDWVLAFGAPFGLTQSVSAGIVSAKGRSRMGVIQHAFSYENFIQTDAEINRGNSGGPLVNMKGEVIGINTAIVTGNGGYQGVGFAIPSSLCKKVLDDLIKYKKVVRGYLGVEIEDVTAESMQTLKLPSKEGVCVKTVYPDTPAEQAGLKAGDVIVAFDGKKTAKVDELRTMVASYAIGKKAALKVVRDGKETNLEVTIAEQPETEMTARIASWQDRALGITVQTLEPAVARMLEVDGEVGVYTGEEGVLVVEVDPKGPAAANGIKRNDLIKEVANETVRNLSDYRRIRAETDVKKGILMFVKSGRKAGLVTVK